MKQCKFIILLILLFFDTVSEAENKRFSNIVFILADDLGYGDLSCLNPQSKIHTPNLDQLAKEGIIFTDAHSGSAVFTPTQYGILTRRYCRLSKLKNGVLWSWAKPLIEPDRLTVGDLLRQHGYSTACIGKCHLGWECPVRDNSKIQQDSLVAGNWSQKSLREAFGRNVDFSANLKEGPLTRGFDYYFGDDIPNIPPYFFIENNHTVDIPDKEKPNELFGFPGLMLDGWKLEDVMLALTAKTVKYIKNENVAFRRKAGAPFFLYFPLTYPYCPIATAKDFQV